MSKCALPVVAVLAAAGALLVAAPASASDFGGQPLSDPIFETVRQHVLASTLPRPTKQRLIGLLTKGDYYSLFQKSPSLAQGDIVLLFNHLRSQTQTLYSQLAATYPRFTTPAPRKTLSSTAGWVARHKMALADYIFNRWLAKPGGIQLIPGSSHLVGIAAAANLYLVAGSRMARFQQGV